MNVHMANVKKTWGRRISKFVNCSYLVDRTHLQVIAENYLCYQCDIFNCMFSRRKNEAISHNKQLVSGIHYMSGCRRYIFLPYITSYKCNHLISVVGLLYSRIQYF